MQVNEKNIQQMKYDRSDGEVAIRSVPEESYSLAGLSQNCEGGTRAMILSPTQSQRQPQEELPWGKNKNNTITW